VAGLAWLSLAPNVPGAPRVSDAPGRSVPVDGVGAVLNSSPALDEGRPRMLDG
jgi:hypothetical protein